MIMLLERECDENSCLRLAHNSKIWRSSKYLESRTIDTEDAIATTAGPRK